jgi:phenylpyruvate tautomerase PptA (4-oxalocrotonate tautomerase family)
MPYFKIQTKQKIAQPNALVREASKFLSEILGKPEGFIMISLHDEQIMLFGGSDEPALFCELKSIGLPSEKTKETSRQICSFLSERTAVATDRIYIEFTNVERSMWGWNKTTFEK